MYACPSLYPKCQRRVVWSRAGTGTEGLVGHPRGPNSSAICNIFVGHGCTNITSDAQSCHYITDVLLVSSQKPQSQQLCLCYQISASRDGWSTPQNPGTCKLSNISWDYGGRFSVLILASSQRITTSASLDSAVGDSMASLEYSTCSFFYQLTHKVVFFDLGPNQQAMLRAVQQSESHSIPLWSHNPNDHFVIQFTVINNFAR